MTFYYHPTVTEAFSSVQYIMTEVNFDWIRSSMVSKYHGSNDEHVFHVYLTGEFPRINLGYRCGFGWHVTGYSLPRDQISYWAVNIVTDVPEAIPLIGSLLVELLRGSASVGQSTLTLFTVYNTFGLPLLNCCIYVDALSNDT